MRCGTRPDGVEVVQEALRALATTYRSKAIPRALRYVEAHAHRMRYVTLEARQLSIGSGQVESAVRRVINLRFKAPGSFWTETTVSGLMHLRAAFKAGHPLEGSFYEGLFVKRFLALFIFPLYIPISSHL